MTDPYRCPFCGHRVSMWHASIPRRQAPMWDNRARPQGAGNTPRPLTRSTSIYPKEGLPMKGTRTPEPCAVPDCDRPSKCRGYCNAHYARFRKYGHPQEDVPIKGMPKRSERGDIVARIMSKTERSESGCLVFTGEISHSGYGRISWASKSWVAHRAMWTALVGPIPEALAPDGSIWTIDHLCSNRACVNVGHLEMVSLIENTRRGGGITKAWAKNRSKPKKHYPHGTNERYTARRCRCDECRRAHAAYIRAVRNRHKESA